MASLKEVLKLYRFANQQRDQFYNVKWRLFVGLLILVAMWFAYTTLTADYPATADRVVVSATSNTSLQASQRMFNWFIVGFMLGFLAFALMVEGEFLIATSKAAHKLAEDVGLVKKPKRRTKR